MKRLLSAVFILMIASSVLACAGSSPEPQTVVETIVVTQEVEKVVKETVIVEKEVEKEVTQEVEITSTPEPAQSAVLDEEGCGHELILATNGDSSSVNPIFGTDSSSRTDRIHEPLVFLDSETLEPIPWLAESWDISEDGTTYTFHLREGPEWPDGTPLTSADFKFTLETILSPELNSDWQAPFLGVVGADEFIAAEADEVEGVVIIDDRTFEINLQEPNAAFLSEGARNLKPIPLHLLENEELSREHPYMLNPVGVGPYQLVEWAQGDHLTLEAKDNYWGEPVCAERILDRYITDMSALALALESGDVDQIAPVLPREAVRWEGSSDINVYQPPSDQMDALYFNVENEYLADPRVRQAIAMTINREEFIESVLSGLNRPVYGHVVPASWAYDESIRTLEQDLEQAEELLVEAGYPDGFTISLVTNAGNTVREQFLTYLQAQLGQIGITAEPEFQEWSTFITGIADGDFEIAFLESRAGVPDPSSLFADYHTDGPRNYGNYSNPEVDRLLEEAQITTDIEERKELYRQVQEILVQELPRLGTWEYSSVFATRSNIENVQPSSLGNSWDAPHWRKR